MLPFIVASDGWLLVRVPALSPRVSLEEDVEELECTKGSVDCNATSKGTGSGAGMVSARVHRSNSALTSASTVTVGARSRSTMVVVVWVVVAARMLDRVSKSTVGTNTGC